MYFFILLFNECIVTFGPPSNYRLTGTFSGDFMSLTSSMTKAALSGVQMLNFWHILLLASVEVDEDSAVASLIGVAEVSPLGVKGWVSASLQHSFSRLLATSCLSSFFKR
jgi:hypothetical protein